jgi:hypothetical protein
MQNTTTLPDLFVFFSVVSTLEMTRAQVQYVVCQFLSAFFVTGGGIATRRRPLCPPPKETSAVSFDVTRLQLPRGKALPPSVDAIFYVQLQRHAKPFLFTDHSSSSVYRPPVPHLGCRLWLRSVTTRRPKPSTVEYFFPPLSPYQCPV